MWNDIFSRKRGVRAFYLSILPQIRNPGTKSGIIMDQYQDSKIHYSVSFQLLFSSRTHWSLFSYKSSIWLSIHSFKKFSTCQCFNNVTAWSIFIIPEYSFIENILQSYWQAKRNCGKGLFEVSKPNEIHCTAKLCLQLWHNCILIYFLYLSEL